MLQQTQVDTVIPYFERFMSRFPEVADLANADIDEVLHLWTGLGYYARARNLHKCAVAVHNEYGGEFPKTASELNALPGIGPSTAAAISSIAYQQPDAILDGNVKRVLARFFAVEGWPGNKKIETQLWQKARELMPQTRCRDYTQAIMDLGATLCTRSKPDCENCPVKHTCQAYAAGTQSELPTKKPKKERPTKHCQMLLIENTKSEVLLYQRPPTGIWGGLWSLPEIDTETDAEDHVSTHYGEFSRIETLPQIKHQFSHYTLIIQPKRITIARPLNRVMENSRELWYNPHFPNELGLAAPVKQLIHG
jgi:A/G-specific adenine glycosylase